MTFSHIGQSLRLRALATIVGSQSSSKCCGTWKQNASFRFTYIRSHNFHVFTKLITISVKSTNVFLSKSSRSMFGGTSPCAARTSSWVRHLRGWRSLPQSLFMGVVWMGRLSRRAEALATWMYDLVTFAALLNESGSLLANRFKWIMHSISLSHSWVWESENIFGVDIALKFKISTWIWLSYQTLNVFLIERNNQQIFFVVNFQLWGRLIFFPKI